MNIDQIVKVDITLNTAGISKLGFNTIMVCGPHAKSLERVLAISDPDELLDLGFESTDPIYVAVNTAFSQTPAANRIRNTASIRNSRLGISRLSSGFSNLGIS